MSKLDVVAITADQVRSRTAGDRVPAALEALGELRRGQGGGADRDFARTAGDEIQGLLTCSADVVSAVETLKRLGGWRIGVGLGPVDEPLPDDVRAASGGAFVAAREAVVGARNSPAGLAVRGGSGCGVARAQSAFELLDLAWRRRRGPAWEVALLADEGLAQREIAKRLGVTPSAVSQRMASAAVDEVREGRKLAVWLLDEARSARS